MAALNGRDICHDELSVKDTSIAACNSSNHGCIAMMPQATWYNHCKEQVPLMQLSCIKEVSVSDVDFLIEICMYVDS